MTGYFHCAQPYWRLNPVRRAQGVSLDAASGSKAEVMKPL